VFASKRSIAPNTERLSREQWQHQLGSSDRPRLGARLLLPCISRCCPSHAPRDRPTLMKWISILTLSSAGNCKRGSEATAAVSGVPVPGELYQSIAGYVARGVRGEPRGRKPGAGPDTTNLR